MCCDLRTEQYVNQHVGNQEAEMSQNPQQASGPLWKNPTNCPEEEVPCDLHPLQVLGVDLQLHLHLHLPRLQQLWLQWIKRSIHNKLDFSSILYLTPIYLKHT